MNITPRIMAAAALIAGAAGPALLAQDAPPAADGAALIAEQCTVCHALDLVTAKRGTGEEWRAIVARMRDNGGEFTPEDGEKIIAYLTAAQGPSRAGGSRMR